MFLKMSEINSIYPILSRLVNKKFPVRVSYKLSKLIAAIEVERKSYQEEFHKLLQVYAEFDEDGNLKTTDDKENIIIKTESLDEFQKEYIDLLNLEVELPDVKFSIEDFENCDFTPAEVYELSKIIEE